MVMRTSRRGFLKASAVVGVGVLGAPFVLSAEARKEKVKMAVVGAGGQGGAGMGTASGQQLVAVCDVDLKRIAKSLDDAKKRNADLKVFTDYRKLSDEVKGLEAVWVATPDHNHFPASIRALEAGAAVYCEKPLTHDLWEARKLREVATAKKLPTQMGNQGHSSETIRLICEYIWAGALGT